MKAKEPNAHTYKCPYYEVVCSNTLTNLKTHTIMHTHTHIHTFRCNIANQSERVYLLAKEREEKTLDIFYILSAVLIQSICYEKELFAARAFPYECVHRVCIHTNVAICVYIYAYTLAGRTEHDTGASRHCCLHDGNGRCVFVVSLSLYISI